ncbi:hypothetical protein LCGC14_1621180 [marine sediment metagenome]|uniref:Uncharacterized protein n=1 Tax=marine sediment metagenome TaxID=412755 RepID=A0A0F9L5C1_9ZZZZ
MKTFIAILIALFLGGSAQAAITERVIYAGDTPLASDCQVTQTGLMELTVMPCFWTTTGQARIVPKEKVLNLTGAISRGDVEMLPDGKRVRGWLIDKQGNIIERSATYRVTPKAVLTITAGQKYVVYMLQGPGQTINIALMDPADRRPNTFIDYLVFNFNVPAGTTDLSAVAIEVFTVRPNFPPAKGLFEK